MSLKEAFGWLFAAFLAGTIIGATVGNSSARYDASKTLAFHYGRVGFSCQKVGTRNHIDQ